MMTRDDKKIIRNLIIFCVTFSIAFAGYKVYDILNKPLPYIKPSSHQPNTKASEEVVSQNLLNEQNKPYINNSDTNSREEASLHQNLNQEKLEKNDDLYKNDIKNHGSIVKQETNSANQNKRRPVGEVANPLDEKEELLLQALILGNIEDVKRYIGLGANVNDFDKLGNTILARALEAWKKSISKEQINTLRYILAMGVDINLKNFSGYTPLNKYISNGGENKTVISILLNNLADINTQNNDGFTPLHEAVERGNAELVEFLIDHKADKELLTKSKQTALDIAKNIKNDKIIELLQ